MGGWTQAPFAHGAVTSKPYRLFSRGFDLFCRGCAALGGAASRRGSQQEGYAVFHRVVPPVFMSPPLLSQPPGGFFRVTIALMGESVDEGLMMAGDWALCLQALVQAGFPDAPESGARDLTW